MRSILTGLLSATCLSGIALIGTPAVAQTAPAEGESVRQAQTVVVTGSRIRRQALDSATPLQIFSPEELRRDAISSPEQFIMSLNSNGNGNDNLAAQSDVAGDPAQRNVNGGSFANLRGQGAGGTLVLLNGRRLATHGLATNGAVDVNQIPLAAIQRIETLKDGASAIYGTDAIGGVINYILKEDFEGLTLNAFSDITEAGGGNIFSGSIAGGYGDLEEQGFNLMAVVSYRENDILTARERPFVFTQDVARGLAVDTRGTPFGTIFPATGTLFTTATAPFLPGTTTRATGGINPLDLPGNLGCGAIADQVPYDELLWAIPGAAFACGYDTGRAGILQQPQESLNFIVRGVAKLGEHKIALEYTGSNAESARQFSEIQLFPGAVGQATDFGYRRTPQNAAVYDRVFNQLQAAFPGQVPEANRGLPIAYRWRCMECGPRRIDTEVDTGRALLTFQGPLPFLSDWQYELGVLEGFSEASSVTGGGYYYQATNAALGVTGIRDVMRTGIVNPFLLPGERQSQAALDLLRSAEARGIQIASGRAEVTAVDFSVNGSLFSLPAGDVQAALGVDYREERYAFLGEARAPTARPFIEGAPIDAKPALADVSREIWAFYGEVLIPVLSTLEVTLAVRHDDYSGIGGTTNPKVTARYRPFDWIALRGSYNTGFRAPSFAQLFDPISTAPYQGADLTDPRICPGGVVNVALPGCATGLTGLVTISGGKPDLEPEESEQFTVGFVVEPIERLSVSVDFWRIERTNVPVIFSPITLARNFNLFPERFVRNAAGQLTGVDQRTINSGGAITEGVEFSGRYSFDAYDGTVNLGLDGTLLTRKRERLLPNAPYGPSLIGVFSFYGDLGLEWKHTAFMSWKKDDWTVSLSQVWRSGYLNQVLPGVAGGLVRPPNLVTETDDYITYNLSVAWRGIEGLEATFGIKNLFDEDPPFAISYNSAFGNGSSWEPRVADPRGRAVTLNLGYSF